MPIYVTFYHLDRTMVGRTEGEVTLVNLMGYLDDVEKAKAVGYAKIFDSTVGQASLMPVEREVPAGSAARGGHQHLCGWRRSLSLSDSKRQLPPDHKRKEISLKSSLRFDQAKRR